MYLRFQMHPIHYRATFGILFDAIGTYVHLRTCWKKRVRLADCIVHITQRVLMDGNKLSSTSCRKSEPNWPV